MARCCRRCGEEIPSICAKCENQDLSDNTPVASWPLADHRTPLSRRITDVDEKDAEERYDLELRDNRITDSSSDRSADSRRKIIAWHEYDSENPYNWSSKKKIWVVTVGILVVINSTMGSSLPSNAVPFIAKQFHLTAELEVLPMSMYLVGYVLGPITFGPLSETFGRKIIMITTFIAFTIFTMACALAPNFATLLIFRLLAGINASAPIAVVGGMYADIYGDPVTRGRAMSVYMGGTCIGPVVAPFISGYISPVKGWQWAFWIGLMVAGATLPAVFLLPETFGPKLLAQRAAKLRKCTGNPNIFAPIELDKKGLKQLVTVVLSRPLRMLFTELIVLATCLYLSLAYGIFYMYFEAYPIIFQGIYKQSYGVSGLMFLPIGSGIILAVVLFLWYDAFLRKAQKNNKAWTKKEEMRRLPVAFIGGPLYVISLFWLGWTSRPDIPFVVPMLAGIPFGTGFILIFMALLNYLTDAYEIFAASAMAAASCARSIAGAALPFAAKPMYNNLGVPWASSLLAFLSLGMCLITFAFVWKGQAIRDGSKFCQLLKEKKRQELEELEREQRRSAQTRQAQNSHDGGAHNSKEDIRFIKDSH